MSTGGLGSDLSVESGESGLGHSQASQRSPSLHFPCLLVHQLNKVRELHTHLVTLLSTFTWGTRRARKSLEARVTQISKEGSLVPQPPERHSTGQTQRREQSGSGMGGEPYSLISHERNGLATLSACPESSRHGRGFHRESGPATYLEP